jgi:hypothetical protein
MGEIRDKDVIKTRPITVSPLFTLPKDLDEGSVRRADLADDADVVDFGDGFDDEGGNPDDAATAPTPTGNDRGHGELDPRPVISPGVITVKSQTLRQAEDGTTVVDVVFEFEDVPGATGYEVRLAQ